MSMLADNSHPFPYLQATAEQYGVDAVQVRDTRGRTFDQGRFIQALTQHDLASIARTYLEIERRQDGRNLSDWIRQRGDTSDGLDEERRRAFVLFVLFARLGDRGIEPFSSRAVKLEEPEHALDWNKLPAELRLLAEPAEKFGRYQFPADVDRFLENITEAEYAQLKNVADVISRESKRVDSFLDAYPMTEHKEAELVYFLCALLDNFDFAGTGKHGGKYGHVVDYHSKANPLTMNGKQKRCQEPITGGKRCQEHITQLSAMGAEKGWEHITQVYDILHGGLVSSGAEKVSAITSVCVPERTASPSHPPPRPPQAASCRRRAGFDGVWMFTEALRLHRAGRSRARESVDGRAAPRSLHGRRTRCRR